MLELIINIITIISLLIFGYFFIIVISYWLIIINAFFQLKTNMNLINSNIDLPSEALDGVSIIIPAYNEEKTITATVNSLLKADYPEYEIIIVNDGFKDKTMEKLITTFNLHLLYDHQLPCQPIESIYINMRDPHIILLNKVNGGKADALNAGINYSRYELICCIDADCIIEKQAIKKN